MMRLVPENSPWPRMLVWPLGLAAALFMAAARWIPDLLYQWAHCPLHDTTGLPCFTCGGTHCLVSLAEGRWQASLLANPLVLIGTLVLSAWAVYAVLATFIPAWRRSLWLTPGDKRTARWLAVLIILTNWAYLFRQS